MGFLESKQVLHRNLSARNCLLTEMDGNLIVKVSDFGMSRYTTMYYNFISAAVPVRWYELIIYI